MNSAIQLWTLLSRMRARKSQDGWRHSGDACASFWGRAKMRGALVLGAAVKGRMAARRLITAVAQSAYPVELFGCILRSIIEAENE